MRTGRRSPSRPFRLVVAIGLATACAHGTAARRGPAADVRAEVDRAEAAEKARQHDVARAHYQRAIAAARDAESIAFARHEYAETLISWGEAPEARAQLEIAVAANPADPGAWHDLGLLRHHAGDDAGAIQALQRAEQLAPRDTRPRTALAALYWKRGDRASAAREYRGLLELDLPDRLRARVEWALAELAKP
jgi:tetratricopeptide (TPR) repeat protein